MCLRCLGVCNILLYFPSPVYMHLGNIFNLNYFIYCYFVSSFCCCLQLDLSKHQIVAAATPQLLQVCLQHLKAP